MSHVTYEWATSHIVNESCHIWMSHVTYCKWVMSHMNELRHYVTYEGARSHVNESYHLGMSHITREGAMSHTNEPCHIWMSQVTYEVMSHVIDWLVYTWHGSFAHSHVTWHMSHMNVSTTSHREVGGWGRVPISKKLMSPTPRRKW